MQGENVNILLQEFSIDHLQPEGKHKHFRKCFDVQYITEKALPATRPKFNVSHNR